VVVVRNASDEKLYYTRRVVGAWATWTLLDGLVTDASPAVAYNPVTQDFWLAARDSRTGRIKSSRLNPRISGGPPTPWRVVGGKGTLRPWSAPAITYESDGAGGGRLRIHAADGTAFGRVHQTVSNGTRFRAFKRLISEPRAQGVVAATVVNGDVNLFTIRDGQVFESLAK
jgi:hypothetical protein